MKKILTIGILAFIFTLNAEIPGNYIFEFSGPNVETLESGNILELEKKYVVNNFNTWDDKCVYSPYYRENGPWETGEDNIAKHETQGLANINGDYWIISKNKWIDTFLVTGTLFSDSDKIDTIDGNDKFGDIDFFDGELYVPNGNSMEIYEWDEENFNKKYDIDLGLSSFGVAVHPMSRDVFAYADNDGYIYGYKFNAARNDFKCTDNTIGFYTKSGVRINHEDFTNNHWTQGMDFSPNGRYMFYVHDDEHDEDSNYTGVYVYYFDDENMKKIVSDSCYNSSNPIKATLVGFLNIKYDPDQGAIGGKTIRLDELEGIDVGYVEGYGLRVLMLHNKAILAGIESHSVLHFITGDYDGDSVRDIYDNCPLIGNNNQLDFDNDGIGNACDDDLDGDGIKNYEDKCIYYNDPENRTLFLCNDADKDSVCDGFTVSDLVNCNELTENQARDLYNKKLGSHLLIENWSCFFTDIDIIDNCNGTPNKFQYEGGELMYGMNLNGIGSAGTGAFYHGKIINTAAYKRLYGSHGVQYIYGHYWQPDHNLDGKGDACDYGNINNPNDVGTRYSKVINTDSYTKKGTDPLIRNEYLTIDMKMFGQNENVDDTREQSLRYCNLPIDQVDEN
ncbi:MAG TPA: thrombospondin type 3 repeat-containing protein [bacterium]|nr:thrombospondin type 3 repeat-containing protein [bacterium]HQO90735.1 thrombospondin type 3 repeat-containing protein [bacterium]